MIKFSWSISVLLLLTLRNHITCFYFDTSERGTVKTRRREIAIELDRVVVVKAAKKPAPVVCQDCGLETPFIAAVEAHLLAGISLRRCIRLIEGERLHFIETADGMLFICLTSLLEYKRKGENL
jgi:hypothetical protein